jgi:NSS family neurotransmitter:Na+ symporter
MLELAAGRRRGQGIVGVFAERGGNTKWLGLLLAIGGLVLLSYYLVVTGWAIGYLVLGVGAVHTDFNTFTVGGNSVIFYLVAFALTIVTVLMGVRAGIERANKVLMPMLVLLVVGLAIYGAFLPGWPEAMSFYLTPDLGSLASPRVWLSAFGQVFFSLGVGMGVMVTYGAYMSDRENVPRSSIVVAASDTMIAFLAGMIVFPIVFSFGGEPAAGAQLAFASLPLLFERMHPVVGYVLALLFYLTLSIAAVTSAISLLEMGLVAAREATGISRNQALAILAPLLLVAGLPSALSYSGVRLSLAGKPVFDFLDTTIGDYGLPVGVLVTALVIGWWLPSRSLQQAIGGGFVGWSCLVLVRLVVPVVILGALVQCVITAC